MASSVPAVSESDCDPTDPLDASPDATSWWLLDRQRPDGHWVGELEGDTILESEYVLLMTYLGREDDPVCVKACRFLL